MSETFTVLCFTYLALVIRRRYCRRLQQEQAARYWARWEAEARCTRFIHTRFPMALSCEIAEVESQCSIVTVAVVNPAGAVRLQRMLVRTGRYLN